MAAPQDIEGAGAFRSGYASRGGEGMSENVRTHSIEARMYPGALKPRCTLKNLGCECQSQCLFVWMHPSTELKLCTAHRVWLRFDTVDDINPTLP